MSSAGESTEFDVSEKYLHGDVRWALSVWPQRSGERRGLGMEI